MDSKERKETLAAGLDMVTLEYQVLQGPLDLLDLQAGMMSTLGTIQLKERKVILDHQEYLKFKVWEQALTFTL